MYDNVACIIRQNNVVFLQKNYVAV